MRRTLIALVPTLALAAPAGAQPPPEEPDPSITDGYAFRARMSCFCPRR